MHVNYNTNAPKRPVNLTANSDLVNLVRGEKGNLSKLFEQSMISFLAEQELAHWKEENKAAFDSYNSMIAERGSVSEEIGLLL
ncbi:MAG: type II toxin-antitoxin system CcdA family antitoxin [Desulfuromonadaceae bacterium]